MSHPASGFGATHAGVGHSSIEDGTDENATDRILVVQIRLLRAISGEVFELAIQRLCSEDAGQ
jgi:hypothetical protein